MSVDSHSVSELGVRGAPVDPLMIQGWFGTLVNKFYKILPIREQEDPSMVQYMCGLQTEMIGCGSLITAIGNDPDYLTLLATLQYLIDHSSVSVKEVRRLVFSSISICKKLSARHAGGDV